jgi:hypothetical protein
MTKNAISQPSKNVFVFVFGQEQQVQSHLKNFREDLRSCIYADSSTIFQSFLLNSGRRAVINNTKTIIEITRNVRKSLLAIMSLPWYEVLRVAQKPVNATLTAALLRTTKTNRELRKETAKRQISAIASARAALPPILPKRWEQHKLDSSLDRVFFRLHSSQVDGQHLEAMILTKDAIKV